MKKLILVFFIFIPGIIAAQIDSVPEDTTNQNSDAIEQGTTTTEQETAGPSTAQGDSNNDNSTPCACIPTDNELGIWHWLLVFLPAIIFISIVGILFSKGLKDFNFSEALKENELTKITIQNPLYQNSTDPEKVKEIPPTIEITANVTVVTPANPVSNTEKEYKINEQSAAYRASISRYIALISSLMIIIIAVSLSSFFIYHYIRTSCPPVLEGLSAVLIALGVGIVPYAANKVSSALAANKSEA